MFKMDNKINFDLQLFAEGGEGTDPTAGMTVQSTSSGGTIVSTPDMGQTAQIAGNTVQSTFTDPKTGQTYNLVPITKANGSEGVSTVPASDPVTPTEAAVTPPTTTTPEVQQSLQQAAAVKAEVTAKGIDFDALSKEFDKNGELSAESLSKLDKAGYPKALVDAFIAGQQANADAFVNSVYKLVGGESQWGEIQKFVQSQGKDMVATVNAVLNSGDLNQIGLAVKGIQAQMTSKFGTANPSILGQSANVASITPYASSAEVVKAMSDPRYQVDAKYTQEVYARLNVSDVL